MLFAPSTLCFEQRTTTASVTSTWLLRDEQPSASSHEYFPATKSSVDCPIQPVEPRQ